MPERRKNICKSNEYDYYVEDQQESSVLEESYWWDIKSEWEWWQRIDQGFLDHITIIGIYFEWDGSSLKKFDQKSYLTSLIFLRLFWLLCGTDSEEDINSERTELVMDLLR